MDFLDLNFNLTTGFHAPYRKPLNQPLFIHKDSNHPPSVINNIPESINKRISNISSNQNILEGATNVYQEALDKSGYDYNLKFNPCESNNNQAVNKRKRTRNVTWFNPPFSDNVATNIGKKFFRLLDKCFPPGHQLH